MTYNIRHLVSIWAFLYISCIYPIVSVGHKGACGYAPENTLSSFAKAVNLGVDMIELDVRTCKTGELVVFHDPTLNRLTGRAGFIKDTSLSELKTVTIKKSKEKIPTLDQVFDLVNRRCVINIELKGEETPWPVIKLVEKYVHEKGWSYDRFLITSFDHHKVRLCKQLCPKIKTGIIMAGIPISYGALADAAMADVVIVFKDTINQAMVDDIHSRAKKVFVFTVNEVDEMQQLVQLGVDGIISDFPDRVRNSC